MNLSDKILNNIASAVKEALNEAYIRKTDNITPTVELMKQWFMEFNKRFFNNELPMIKLETGNCGIHTWGCFYFERRWNRRTSYWTESFKPDSCRIVLNDSFSGTELNLRNTMIHEMVHYWIYYKYNYNPRLIHGAEFLMEAKKINSVSEFDITPTNDYVENDLSDIGLSKYKNRITDTYIIITYEGVNQYGNWHAVRTDEKHVNDMYKSLKRWKTWKNPPKFYRMKIENPAFGVKTVVNRGGN